MSGKAVAGDASGPKPTLVLNAANGRKEPILPIAARQYFCTNDGFRSFAAVANCKAWFPQSSHSSHEGLKLPFNGGNESIYDMRST